MSQPELLQVDSVQQYAEEIASFCIGATWLEGYSLHKNECLIQLEKENIHYCIQLVICPEQAFIFTHKNRTYERPSSVYRLFTSIEGKKISEVLAIPGERMFAFTFETESHRILFKLFGRQSNIILPKGETSDYFRPHLLSDRQQDWDVYLTKAKPVSVRTESENRISETWNQIGSDILRKDRIERTRKDALLRLRKQIEHLEYRLESSKKKLQYLETRVDPAQQADVLLAYQHQIPENTRAIRLFNFYTQQEELFRIQPKLRIHEQAEKLYGNAKNGKIEQEQLREKIAHLESIIPEFKETEQRCLQSSDYKELQRFIKSVPDTQAQSKPYRQFTWKGWQILAGKSAKDNDKLTFSIAHKNDIWLHAYGVGGSHVILRQRAGQIPGEDVIKVAAGIAAYYSKSAGSGMVSVMYCQRKMVRKPKGADAGAVLAQRFQTIMVEPLLING